MARKGITVYLQPELEARILRTARYQRRSASSVVAAAIKARYEQGEGDKKIEESAKRQLSRVDARLNKVIGESLILKEIVLLFVRVWLEHNPPIDEDLEESAAASAEARFSRFLDFVAQGLKGGASVASELSPQANATDAGDQASAIDEAHS